MTAPEIACPGFAGEDFEGGKTVTSKPRQEEVEAIPIISLWMPWANWVMLGWKPIETRLHRRFYSLAGKRIGIHASQKWDDKALELALPYLTGEQIDQTQNFLRIGGAVIGTVMATVARELTTADSWGALIDCQNTKRHGLILADPKIIEAIPMRGKQGIWYAKIAELTEEGSDG